MIDDRVAFVGGIENQFLWSPEVVQVLIDKLQNPPSDDFRVVVLLPARRTTGRTSRAASSPP